MQTATIAFQPFNALADEACQERIRSARARLGKRAVILGHHYQRADVYQHADLTGDSLKLSKLAAQTVFGSALLVKTTGLHPSILRDQVTTPGGTTICAIHELEAHGLRSMLISAVETATQRSSHLRAARGPSGSPGPR